jgi:hypothetical protein
VVAWAPLSVLLTLPLVPLLVLLSLLLVLSLLLLVPEVLLLVVETVVSVVLAWATTATASEPATPATASPPVTIPIFLRPRSRAAMAAPSGRID